MKNYNRYSSRDSVKNYFPMPNNIFCLGLSPGELSVYAYLLFREDRKTYQCYPSYKTIGNAIGISKNTVKKYIDSLVQKQLITTEQTQVTLKNGRKRNGNLRYTIRPIEEAVSFYYDSQIRKFHDEQTRLRIENLLKELSENRLKSG